jgi:hypothetical protein
MVGPGEAFLVLVIMTGTWMLNAPTGLEVFWLVAVAVAWPMLALRARRSK